MNFNAIVLAFGVLGALGVVFGVVLTAADKMFAVEVDDRVANVRACLPGANCGACGFVGCDSFAEAVVDGSAPANGCIPGGAGCARAIGEVLNIEVKAASPKAARVICQGTEGVAKNRYTYDGLRSCRVAASLSGGPKQCRFACVGLGDCVFSCKFDAITIKNGIASIDPDKCTGCGTCASVCPRDVISLKEKDSTVIVRCRNSDVAREARNVCMKACIACKRCVKACEYDAIVVEGGFARIDPEKCTRCGECAKVCPCKCITMGDEAIALSQ